MVSKKGAVTLSFLLVSLSAQSLLFAKDLGTQGSVYEIKERDALEYIDQKLQAMQRSGEISRQQEKLKEKALFNLEHPKAVKGLKATQTPRVFEKDLTITLTADIRDEKEKLIHASGTRINPLSKLFCHKTLLFFDGEDSQQLAWALSQYQHKPALTKLVLINGPVLELIRTHQVPFYFDQAGRLTEYFKIEQVPALVSQFQDKLQIREIKL